MKRIAVVVTVLALLAAVDAHAYEDGDFQIWHTEGQEIAVTKGWKIPVEEEFRYGGDAGELYYQHYDIGISYDVNKNLNVGAYYRQIYEGEKGKFKPEFRPHIDVTPKTELYGFKIENRNRLDYRLYDDNREDILQYRTRLLIRSPWKFTPLNIQPYVSDEVFVWLNGAVLRRNRLDAGISLEFMKNVKGDIYYRLQGTKKSGRWTDYNILGLKLKVAF